MKLKNLLISIISVLLFGGIFYYFALPPMNIHSLFFWIFVSILLIVFTTVYCFLETLKTGKFNGNKNILGIPFLSVGVIIIGIIIIDLCISPIFNSKSYSKRIDINENSSFKEDVKEVDFNALPLLDKNSSQKLGDRVMGQMPEMVSQYYVSNLYTQINYNNNIIRVTPLEYNGFFKYLNNNKKGVAGYITVNSVSGDSKLIKLDKGMKYMPSAYFSKDLYRHLRFAYPTLMFGDETFEIDNDGNPYWIVPIIKYSGVGLKKDISGVVIVNPITGKMKKYKVEDVPSWVDHVYPADLIIEQVDDWGSYKSGFLNSIISQKNVVMTTDGYNYTVMDDDVYLYTGITSVASDESNIGFILTNLRTKKTSYYAVPGAEEYSAMASAEGQVQQMKYIATFPLLINLNNKPTYLISLKDNAGLVKMYAFVDVENYQKVVVTDASKGITVAASKYLEEIADNNIVESDTTKDIVISNISSATIEGNTYYYIVDNNGKKYKASIKLSDKLPFLGINNTLNISYRIEKDIIDILKIN